jgi:acetyl-CoA carboxylase biotin carboxyl carrier protein
MDLEQLRQILELVDRHELAEFEIEHEGLRLKVRKAIGAPPAVVHTGELALPAAPSSGADARSAGPAMAPVAPADSEEPVELAIVKSPIVGTFYRSPEPNAASFVELGAVVKKGQTLCIIEAMKLMNELESDFEGQVVNVYVENGQPVQYGERLFAIRTQ